MNSGNHKMVQISHVKENPREVIRLIKNKIKLNRVKREFDRLVALPAYKEIIYRDPFPLSAASMYGDDFIQLGDLGRELYWEACAVSHFSSQLSDFLDLKAAFEEKMVERHYGDASQVLDEVKERYGWSLWWMENKISLLESSEGLEKQKEFSTSITQDESIDGVIRYFTFQFSLRAEKNLSADRFDAMVVESIRYNEMDKEVSDYIIFRTNIFSDEEITCFEQIAAISRRLPIIDRFLGLIRLIQLIISTHPSPKTIALLSKSAGLLEKFANYADVKLIRLYINPSLHLSASDASNKFIRALGVYTEGDYFACLEQCKELTTIMPTSFEVIELYARTIVRLEVGGHKIPEEHISERWLELAVADLLRRENKSDDAFLRLIKFAYVNSSFSLSFQIMGFLAREYSSLAKGQYYSILSSLNNSPFNPSHCFSLIGKGGRLYLSNLKRILPSTPVIDFFSNIVDRKTDHFDADISMQLPESRRIKYSALFKVRAGDIVGAISEYKSLISLGSLLDYHDGIRGLARCYLDTCRYNDCISLIASAYLENSNLAVFLPVTELLSRLNLTTNREVLDNIDTPIVYDIYAVFYGLNKEEEKSIVIQEVLDYYGVDKPSQLIDAGGDVNKQRMIYFLHQVCTVEAIDGFPVFSGPLDICEERIHICQRLIELDATNSSKYQEEIKSLTQQILVDQGIHEIDNSRIYVDVDGVKRIIDKELRENFKRYLDFISKGMVPKDQFIEDLLSKLKQDGMEIEFLALNIPADEVGELFEGMVASIRDVFVSSNEYGLDGHLSVRVRHGTLSGELRSPLQAANLITTRDKSGHYHDNQYWKESLSELMPDEMNFLMDALAQFSKEVDSLIELFKNEWLQVRNSKKEEGLFVYDLDQAMLYRIRDLISESTEYEEFVDLVIAELWKKTDDCLANIRTRIANDLEPKFECAFDRLRSSIEDLGIVHNMSNLFGAIAKAKSDINTTLEVVSNWFTRSSSKYHQDYPASLITDISKATITNLYPNQKFSPLINVEPDILLRGSTLTSLTSMLLILINNAVCYCELPSIPTMTINITRQNDTLRIVVENHLGDNVDLESVKVKLDEKLDSIGEKGSIENVSKEGGTGLHKVAKIIHFDLQAKGAIHYVVSDSRECSITIEINRGGLFA